MGIITFIGFTAIWIIGFLIIGFIINTNRAKSGVDINDFLTGFITGLALGPFAVMSGFDPRRQNSKKSKGLIPGGIVGMILFFSTYFNL
jgi:hypothetical protein|tara:strand:+ start:664 stop:930 length:267 start_codon:yes stop_codon:yes gene_type:complete